MFGVKKGFYTLWALKGAKIKKYRKRKLVLGVISKYERKKKKNSPSEIIALRLGYQLGWKIVENYTRSQN